MRSKTIKQEGSTNSRSHIAAATNPLANNRHADYSVLSQVIYFPTVTYCGAVEVQWMILAPPTPNTFRESDMSDETARSRSSDAQSFNFRSL